MPSTKLSNSSDFEGQAFYIGIDVHKNSWSVTIRSSNLYLVYVNHSKHIVI
jgi:hypothetical protein